MVLLAIALIGAGLACLGFVGFSLLKSRPAVGASGGFAPAADPGLASPPPGPATRRPMPGAGPGVYPPATAAGDRARAFAPRPESEDSAVLDQGGYAEEPASRPAAGPGSSAGGGAAADSRPAQPAASGLDPRDRNELNFLRDRLSGLQRIDPDSLNESLRVFEKTERETPEPAPQLVVTGMLYLDHGRKIPAQLGRRGEIPTRVFSELRRVGNGTLILENSSFLIHCGNTSYSYSAGDLDQILFQGSGLALVPIHPDRPIPLFLTAQVDSVKAYIKKNARIRAL